MTVELMAESLVRGLSTSDRILLINPPVEETRYSWIRWNQPLDLLKIGSFLRREVGCDVELFDFMKPDSTDPSWRVPAQRLRGMMQYREVGGVRFPMWHFGQPYKALRDWVSERRGTGSWREPTQIWITSLCSYWFESVAQTCRAARQALPDAKIVLLGRYPLFMKEHALTRSGADAIVSSRMSLDDYAAALDLYGSSLPPFLALQESSACLEDEIATALEYKIFNFVLFGDRLFSDDGATLEHIDRLANVLSNRIRFHIICGLYPEDMTPRIARCLAGTKFAQLHFEEQTVPGALNVEAYRQARRYLIECGYRIPGRDLSGFVWIGRPDDDLKVLLSRAFATVELLGSLILKPYTPAPNGEEHRRYSEHLNSIPHQDWSPHLFPFARVSGISPSDYHDLYRVAAFLNEKVRGRAFDFLDGTLGAKLLRESLRREVWKLEKRALSDSH
jgi:hypothetical protein